MLNSAFSFTPRIDLGGAEVLQPSANDVACDMLYANGFDTWD
jgi:hypothetical protein